MLVMLVSIQKKLVFENNDKIYIKLSQHYAAAYY